jgi:hypothetical protein
MPACSQAGIFYFWKYTPMFDENRSEYHGLFERNCLIAKKVVMPQHWRLIICDEVWSVFQSSLNLPRLKIRS